MRDRGVDLDGLARNLLLTLGRQRRQRTHVVQTIRQLDQHDPDVVRHRDDHLAEILGLLFLAAQERDLGNLGDSIHQPGDFGPKEALHFFQRGPRILNHVMQQAGDDRRQIEFDLRDDERDVERMRHVGLAGLAFLLTMHSRRILVGAAKQGRIGLRII